MQVGVLRCCELHNRFMVESCRRLRKSLKNVDRFTSGGQINISRYRPWHDMRVIDRDRAVPHANQEKGGFGER